MTLSVHNLLALLSPGWIDYHFLLVFISKETLELEFKDYNLEDYVLDPDFRKWVLKPSAESNIFWNDWLKKNPDKIEVVREARKVILSMTRLKYEAPATVEDEIWQNVQKFAANSQKDNTKIVPLSPESILGHQQKRNAAAIWKYVSVAAAIALLVGFGTILHSNMPPNSEVVNANELPGQIITKSNPKGQKSTIILSDGSKVILNSESQLSYTQDYGNSDRKVRLVGEGFFQVVEDKERPFTVETQYLSTTALGTSFNVLAYTDDLTEVSLLSGKVVVRKRSDKRDFQILNPGELIRLDQDASMIKEKFEPKNKALWRDGILCLEDVPFMGTIKKLERWYGVKIRVENSPHKSLTCNGKFDNEYLSNVLTSLGYSAGFDYEIKDKSVVIRFNY